MRNPNCSTCMYLKYEDSIVSPGLNFTVTTFQCTNLESSHSGLLMNRLKDNLGEDIDSTLINSCGEHEAYPCVTIPLSEV